MVSTARALAHARSLRAPPPPPLHAQGNSKLSKARSAKGGSSEPEPEIQEATGGADGDIDLKIGEEFSQANSKPITVDDFELIKVRQLAAVPSLAPSDSTLTARAFGPPPRSRRQVLGKGSFGKVMLVKRKGQDELMAMKTLRKAALVKRNQLAHTKTERNILQNIRHPFLMRLHYAFQTKDKLYMVIEYMAGGELFHWLKAHKKFSEPRSKLYAAEIGLAIACLHKHDIVYRDLKPENLLLDAEGHIRVTDFGLAKVRCRCARTRFEQHGEAQFNSHTSPRSHRMASPGRARKAARRRFAAHPSTSRPRCAGHCGLAFVPD